jgi:hypothetical protein
VRPIGENGHVKQPGRLVSLLLIVAMLATASTAAYGSENKTVSALRVENPQAAAATWKGEFTKEVAAFRHAAKGKTSLVKTPPLLGEQFQDFNVYSGELLAESRQLGWLDPPSTCKAVQDETVKLLRRMSRHAYGLGDAKDLTPSEYELRSKQLLTLPARLTEAIQEARAC